MKDIISRSQEVSYAFKNADPTVVEVISGLVSLLFGVWLALPLEKPPMNSVMARVEMLAPESIWMLLFVFSSLILIFSPRTRSYYNIGVLLSSSLWFFFFLVACANGISSLAPAAYLSNTLFCVWIYLRRIGGIGDNLSLGRTPGDISIYGGISGNYRLSYMAEEQEEDQRLERG